MKETSPVPAIVEQAVSVDKAALVDVKVHFP
eukprot:CAMPEP_0184482700 /NCGR_PEP_ID=MMETSP0113_2-20130426/4277_1 /TAXON_ID=91329 /ORGANISM="Norrisiella sphaerica, Strain BC52" /LENGTH=30 /DNA_ID= /DNA_START= /DNA_END= /DNA_ORIENTATION=